MNMKPIVAVAIALTVGIVTFAGVLIPAIENGVATEDTYTNTGIFNAKSLTETSETTLSFDHTKPDILTVDGVDIDMSDTVSPYSQVTVIFTNDWFARYILGNQAISVYKCGTNSANAIGGGSVSSGNDLSISISNGSATITFGDTTLTYDVSGDGVILSPTKGDYVIKKASDTAYVNSDSIVYGAGRTDRALGQSSTSFNAILKASIDDGVTAIAYSPQYVFSETESVRYSEVGSHEDLYQLTGFTFNLTAQDVEYPINYNQIFVPTEVTAERTVHADASTILLFQTIPVFIVLGMIVAVVGVLYMKTRR